MKVLYAGSFNPFTIGHQYVYDVACKCFGKENVWLGVGINRNKPNAKQNQEKIKFSLAPITSNVVMYDGLTADLVKAQGFELLIRGIRAGHSLEQEEDLMHWNRKLGGVETILIPTPSELNTISSSLIRELTYHKIDVSEYVNPDVFARWNWKRNDLLPRVYFGRSCSGKSTYIGTGAVDMDKAIWGFTDFTDVTIKSIKESFLEAFYAKNKYAMDNLIALVGDHTNWEKVYSFKYIDAAVIGLYWDYIPIAIRSAACYYKLSTSEDNRKEFIKNRKISQEFIECADFFYKDVPYFDKEIIIDLDNEG